MWLVVLVFGFLLLGLFGSGSYLLILLFEFISARTRAKKKTPKPGSGGATTAGDREPQMGVRRVLVSGRQLQPFWSIPGAGGEGSLL